MMSNLTNEQREQIINDIGFKIINELDRLAEDATPNKNERLAIHVATLTRLLASTLCGIGNESLLLECMTNISEIFTMYGNRKDDQNQ